MNNTQSKRPIHTNFGFWVLIIGALLFLGAILNNSSSKQTSNSNINTNEPLQVSAIQLQKDYEANPIAADEKYRYKTLIVSGKIGDIDRSISKEPFVGLSTNNLLNNVLCYFNQENESVVAKLNKDQIIKILGKCDGRRVLNVVLEDCNIISMQETQAELAQTEDIKKSASSTITDEPSISVDSASFYQDYCDNEVAADTKYKNKIVQITGEILSINSSNGDPWVKMTSDNILYDVYFNFNSDDNEQIQLLAQLSKGQEVSIIGVCQGLLDGLLSKAINFKNCKVVNIKPYDKTKDVNSTQKSILKQIYDEENNQENSTP